jgi:predicted helicase
MKCLDEGVDVPQARTAILLSNSGNPREHIQRIGRVIRRYPGKYEATIYDVIVLPPLGKSVPELKEIERSIIEKELHRYEEVAQTSINNAEAMVIISETIEALQE